MSDYKSNYFYKILRCCVDDRLYMKPSSVRNFVDEASNPNPYFIEAFTFTAQTKVYSDEYSEFLIDL